MNTLKINYDSNTVLGKKQMNDINIIISKALDLGINIEVSGIIYNQALD